MTFSVLWETLLSVCSEKPYFGEVPRSVQSAVLGCVAGPCTALTTSPVLARAQAIGSGVAASAASLGLDSDADSLWSLPTLGATLAAPFTVFGKGYSSSLLVFAVK